MSIVPFVGTTYQHKSFDVSAQRTINFYPETLDNSDTKSPRVLIGRPGVQLYADASGITDGAPRGIITANAKASILETSGRSFVVIRNKLIEINSDATLTERGTISDLNSRAYMVDAGAFLMIADGTDLYSFEYDTNALDTVSLPFAQPTQIAYIGERLIAINADPTVDVIPNYNKYYFSAISDPTTFSALDWNEAVGNAQQCIAIGERGDEFFVFSDSNFAVWKKVGNAKNPYTRMNGVNAGIGCRAKDSVISHAGQVFWLGSSKNGNNQFFGSSGYQAQKISTYAIENELDKVDGTTTDAKGFSFQKVGHNFICWSFLQSDQTWVFDPAEGWSEWATRDTNTNVLRRFGPLYATFANGEILMAYVDGPYIVKLNAEYYQDWTPDGIVPMISIRRSPVYWKGLNEVWHRSFTLDMETGVGTQTGQGQNPRIMLRWSDDGGYTFSNVEKWKPLGKIGQRKVMVQWRRLGRSRERVYEVSITDPIKRVRIQAQIESQMGQK